MTKSKKRKASGDIEEIDNYVRPDKCELCGLVFADNPLQWNRNNIKVHTNSKSCQNNQKKNGKYLLNRKIVFIFITVTCSIKSFYFGQDSNLLEDYLINYSFFF